MNQHYSQAQILNSSQFTTHHLKNQIIIITHIYYYVPTIVHIIVNAYVLYSINKIFISQINTLLLIPY